MPRQYMLVLGGGVVLAAIIVGLVIGSTFANRLTNPDDPIQVAWGHGGGAVVTDMVTVVGDGSTSDPVAVKDDSIGTEQLRIDGTCPMGYHLLSEGPSAGVRCGDPKSLEFTGLTIKQGQVPGLTGTGTSTNPLGVDYPPHTIKFSLQDGDTRNSVSDAVMGLVKQDGSNLGIGEPLTDVTTIKIAEGAAAFGSSIADPNTDLDAVDTREYFDPFIAGGDGSVWIAMTQYGQSHVSYLRANTVTKESDHYNLTNLEWAKALTDINSVGQSWDMVISATGLRLASDIVDLPGPAKSPANITHDTELLADDFETVTVADVGNEILPEPEHITQTGWRWRGEYDINNIPTLLQDNDIGEVNQYQLWARPSDANLPDVDRYAKRDHVFTVIKDADNYITYKVNQDIRSMGNGNERYFSFTKVKGGTIAVGDTVSLELTPPFVTVDRVDDSIGATPSPVNLPTSKAVADRIAADTANHATRENTIPFAASFRDKFSREFKASLTGNDTGEATTSSGNTVPSGAPAGTSDFVALDQANSGGTDQTADLALVAVGDWMRAKSGDKYIIAQILYIQKALNGEFEFWFNPSTAIDETLQYDELPDGAGEVRFYRQGGTAPHGSTLPSACAVGALFILTQVSGSNTVGLYACTAANTWTR